MCFETEYCYIFTGGPGGGKTTVLKQLQEMGCPVVEESGRKIIQNQVATGGNALPWGNVSRYARLMYLHAVLDYEEYAHLKEPCFFDRGIGDVLGYCRLIGLPVPGEYVKTAEKYRYNKCVFLFPFWEEIYTGDGERKQNIQEARETCRVLQETYETLGYEIVPVPYGTPAERAEWIAARTGTGRKGPGRQK